MVYHSDYKGLVNGQNFKGSTKRRLEWLALGAVLFVIIVSAIFGIKNTSSNVTDTIPLKDDL